MIFFDVQYQPLFLNETICLIDLMERLEKSEEVNKRLKKRLGKLFKKIYKRCNKFDKKLKSFYTNVDILAESYKIILSKQINRLKFKKKNLDIMIQNFENLKL